jgi:RES domain-containing protein
VAEGRRVHDDRLLDALDALQGQAFDGTVWRVVREGRPVLDGSRGAGRWNPSNLNVFYAAKKPDGAIAEIYFHLSRGQSVFPSKMRHKLFKLKITTDRTLILAHMADLVALGVEEAKYASLLYSRTQEIADAAAFIGFDGIISPSARFDCENLVLFLDGFNLENVEIVSETSIDWADWRAENRSLSSAPKPY